MANGELNKYLLKDFAKYRNKIRSLDKKYIDLRNSLLLENHKLIRSIAYRFKETCHMEKEDFFQEGVIGFIEGLQKYDSRKGSLSTYLSYWIRQRIRLALKYDGLIIKPAHISEHLSKLAKISSIAKNEDIGYMDEKIVSKMLNIKKRVAKSVLMAITTMSPVSLNYIREDDPCSKPLWERIGTRDSIEGRLSFEDIISVLDKRKRKVIEMRYRKSATLKETGRKLGISKERVRQIEQRCLKQLLTYL